MSYLSRFVGKKYLVFWLLALAAILRVGYVLSQDSDIYWIDGVEYYSLANQIIEGKGYITPEGIVTAYRPVGYPLFLSGVIAIFGKSLLWLRLAQILFSVATVYLIFQLTNRLFGATVARIALLVAAVYPYLVFLPSAILPTCWFSFLVVFGVYVLLSEPSKSSFVRIFSAGIIFGVAGLTRPSAVILILVVAVWLLGSVFSTPRLGILKAVTFGVAVSVVVLPWVYRNYAVMGKATIATNGGRNFWLGNNAHASATSGNNVQMPKALAEKIDATPSEIEREQIYFEQATQFIHSYPSEFLKLTARKAVNFWRFDPVPTSGYPSHQNLARVISWVSTAPVLILGFIGLVVAWQTSRSQTSLVVLMAVAFTLLHAVFISKVRMRLPLDQLLIPFSALVAHRSVDWMWEFILQIKPKGRGVPLVQV